MSASFPSTLGIVPLLIFAKKAFVPNSLKQSRLSRISEADKRIIERSLLYGLENKKMGRKDINRDNRNLSHPVCNDATYRRCVHFPDYDRRFITL